MADTLTGHLPEDLAIMVHDAVQTGEYDSPEHVVAEALRDWSLKRHQRPGALAFLQADIAEGLADIEAGRTGPFDVEEIIRLGRLRLNAR